MADEIKSETLRSILADALDKANEQMDATFTAYRGHEDNDVVADILEGQMRAMKVAKVLTEAIIRSIDANENKEEEKRIKSLIMEGRQKLTTFLDANWHKFDLSKPLTEDEAVKKEILRIKDEYPAELSRRMKKKLEERANEIKYAVMHGRRTATSTSTSISTAAAASNSAPAGGQGGATNSSASTTTTSRPTATLARGTQRRARSRSAVAQLSSTATTSSSETMTASAAQGTSAASAFRSQSLSTLDAFRARRGQRETLTEDEDEDEDETQATQGREDEDQEEEEDPEDVRLNLAEIQAMSNLRRQRKQQRQHQLQTNESQASAYDVIDSVFRKRTAEAAPADKRRRRSDSTRASSASHVDTLKASLGMD